MLGNNNNQNFISFVVFGKYDFKAEECDEITFKRGDPILVLEKDDEHKDGWWKGKTADKMVGLFPVEFTTFINIKHINIDGLFEELDSMNNVNESFTTNSSVGSGSHPIQNNSPQLSLSEMHTPKMKYTDQNSVQSSPGYYNNRMSISSASGIGSVNGSPQVIQQHPQIKPPHLSLNNNSDIKPKEYHSISPTSWTIDHVLAWLEDIGFSACSQIFIDNNIDGMKLLGQSLASLRAIGINQLKDRLKLYNSIVSLKEQYNHIIHNVEENNIDNGVMIDQNQWHQHNNKLYNNQYIIEEERDESVISESPSSMVVMSPKERRNSEFINTTLIDNVNNTRQINGPVGMRPRLNNIVSRDSLQLTSTNFNYYRSAQRVNRAPSQSSKSSISSISSFFRRLSLSKPDKKNDNVFEPMFQHADYQGWLWTRFNKNTKWKKRWVILSREKVYFLKEPKHPVNIKHTIQLNITFSIQPDIHKGKTKYTFNLIDSANQKVVYFSADNHLVMMTWINVLVRATTASSSRLQPLPEGKSPIIGTPNMIAQSTIPGGLQPIYNANHQMIQSSNPNSYHQYQNQVIPQSQNQIIRNQNIPQNNYINSISNAVSPRVQQSVTSTQMQVRNSSIISPQFQSPQLIQPSRRSSIQIPIISNSLDAVDSSALPKVVETKEE